MANDEMRIAPCGIDCAACSIRRAANDPDFAENLAAEWRVTEHPAAQAEWFRCQGCRGPAELVWGEDCAIRACCIGEKQHADCSHCGEFPCPTITAFGSDGAPHHARAFENLKQMRDERGR